MNVNVLFSARDGMWSVYGPALRAAFDAIGISAHIARDIKPAEVDYIVFAPNGPVSDFTPYTHTKAVLGLWAGVESIVENKTLTQPLTRMVDTGLSEGMSQWVAGHVLRHHLGMDVDICRNDQAWQPYLPPLTRDRNVAILGLGTLGQICAKTLVGLGFNVSGWSRRAKDIAGVQTYCGADGLDAVLRQAEILVLLLPLTPDTKNTLNARSLALMPKGAVIINPGRGALIDDGALLAALDSGQVAHATLDVFRIEPLPADHAYWSHANVTVTPHIASETRPKTAAESIAENIRRCEAGESLLHVVDRKAGY